MVRWNSTPPLFLRLIDTVAQAGLSLRDRAVSGRMAVSILLTRVSAAARERIDALRHRWRPFDIAVTKAAGIGEGISHHINVWREALAADRLRPKLDAIGQAELAFLPAALEVSETPVSPAARAISATVMGAFVVGIAWASLGHLDIVATAQGKIVPSERVKTIQPLETAVVRAIHVAEGQAVKAGEVLIEVEITGGKADVDRLKNDYDSARADAARLAALLEADPPAAFVPPTDVPVALVDLSRVLLISQWREHKAKLASLDSELVKKQAEIRTTGADITRLSRMEATILDRTQRRRTLAEKGLGSEIERLRSEQELEETSGQGLVQKSRLIESRAAIDSLKSQRDQAREEFRRDVTTKLAEARAKAASTGQELAKAIDRQNVQRLISPVDGIAQQIDVHTVGGVVTPAQKLLVVVPAGSLMEVEARLANKDIGFVESGQEAIVKIDAFPFTRYGTLTGRVETVSLDAVQDEKTHEFLFPVRVSLADTTIAVENGKRIALTPGMTVTAEVKTGTRRPIEYVLAPLQRYKEESGRER